MRPFFLIVIFLCSSVIAFSQGRASDLVVGDVQVRFMDIQNISDEAIIARVQLREGAPYSQTLVDRSIRSLYGTGMFDYIEAETEEMRDGRVRVIFNVQARYRVGRIEISGNDRLSTRRIRREMNTRIGGALDERRINQDIREVRDLYRDRGYTEVRIDYEIDRNPDTGRGVVRIIIDEGPRLRIARVEFVGNNEFSSRKLRRGIETRRRWFMSWLTGSGRFDENKLQDDIQRLRQLYQSEGYLDVSIPESNVTIDYPTENSMVVTIRIDEGRQYRLGDISIQGNTIFPDLQLFSALNLLPGDVFDPEVLDEDIERLTNIYGSVGYLDSNIRAERRPNVETGDIDLVYNIREGDRFDLESINIEGNTKTKSIVIIRELALQPGRTFNLINMKNSEARLHNTRFFEEVNLNHEPTNIPGRRNLNIRVREGRTGNFQLGAGFSSLESVVFFFEVSQSNFDLFKWRSPFLQGAGQKFRFRGSIGSRSNELALAFEEPWLFQQRLALGFELFRRETDFQSASYNELRTGIDVYMRRRLFGLVDGMISYGFEIVDLKDVQASAPLVIREEAENSPRNISKISLLLARDTRNDLVFTTRGSRTSVSTTFAGVGGDTEYVKFETRNAFFIPTLELGDQVISILLRGGAIWEYSNQRAPFFDRFYLGGPDTLRGFEYREVGPIDSFEPIGGNSYLFGSLEYSIQVAQPLRLALFYDWGFVNQDSFDFAPGSYNDNWGFGIRLLVLGNPLRLDFGIPLTSTRYYDSQGNLIFDNDRGNQFNFSFGTRF